MQQSLTFFLAVFIFILRKNLILAKNQEDDNEEATKEEISSLLCIYIVEI